MLSEKVKIGRRFEDAPLIFDVTFKSLVFTLLVAIVLYIEAVIHSYHEAGGVIASAKHVIVSRDVHHVRATVLCVFLSFVGYNTITAINRRLGDGSMYKLFFVKDKQDPPKIGGV